MKNSYVIWGIGIVIVIGAVSVLAFHKDDDHPTLANPASVNCTQKQGGTLEIKTEANGQVGYCHLPNGSVCEEWALYQSGNCVAPADQVANYKNAVYSIDGQSVSLVNGHAESPAAPGSSSMITTDYFGNEAAGDLNGDGVPDAAFILTQSTGGSGTFYYVVAALKTAQGYEGTSAVLLGDRIAPQTTQIEYGEVVVNYADRAKGEPMTAQPSVGVTKYLVVANNALTEIPANEYAAGNLLLGTDVNKTLGAHLIGSNGKTLYTYDADTDGTSHCTGVCAENWPPYLVPNASALTNLQSGVTGTASTTTRTDGSLQVTYNGKPLYFYKNDTSTSPVAGNGVKGVWHIVKP